MLLALAEPNRAFEIVFVQLGTASHVDQVVTKSGVVPFKTQDLEPSGDVHDVLGTLRDKPRDWAFSEETAPRKARKRFGSSALLQALPSICPICPALQDDAICANGGCVLKERAA
jgi:hypothetical protein